MSTHLDIDRERRLFELVRDPLFVSSADGRLVGANQAGLDLLGMTEAELVSRPYAELLHPEDREATERELAGRARPRPDADALPRARRALRRRDALGRVAVDASTPPAG